MLKIFPYFFCISLVCEDVISCFFLLFQVRNTLGLDRCTLLISTGAPLAKEIQEYFLSLNVPLYDVYGMSESTGMMLFTSTFNHRFLVYLCNCNLYFICILIGFLFNF